MEVLIEAAERWAGVEFLGGVADLGGLAVGQLGVLEVVEVIDDDLATLGNGLDVQRTLARLLDYNVKSARCGWYLIIVALETLFGLGLLRRALVLGRIGVFVTKSIVTEIFAVLVVGEVRNGEGNGDANMRSLVGVFLFFFFSALLSL